MSVDQVIGRLQRGCEGSGVTCHPFLLGWYQEKVSSPFHFPYSVDTLAVLLVSTPSMFEKLFLPYLSSPQYSPTTLDPLDQCFKHFFSRLRELSAPHKVEAIHDFEMSPGYRRPWVLVQTAGHVAGVARYYQREDVNPDPWPAEQRVYGVSMHPEYGGWFAFRGVLIFPDIQAPRLSRTEPRDCVPSHEMRADLLNRFNGNWKDWSYRDVIVGGVKEKYSEKQTLYFSTKPAERGILIQSLVSTQQEDELEDVH